MNFKKIIIIFIIGLILLVSTFLVVYYLTNNVFSKKNIKSIFKNNQLEQVYPEDYNDTPTATTIVDKMYKLNEEAVNEDSNINTIKNSLVVDKITSTSAKVSAPKNNKLFYGSLEVKYSVLNVLPRTINQTFKLGNAYPDLGCIALIGNSDDAIDDLQVDKRVLKNQLANIFPELYDTDFLNNFISTASYTIDIPDPTTAFDVGTIEIKPAKVYSTDYSIVNSYSSVFNENNPLIFNTCFSFTDTTITLNSKLTPIVNGDTDNPTSPFSIFENTSNGIAYTYAYGEYYKYHFDELLALSENEWFTKVNALDFHGLNINKQSEYFKLWDDPNRSYIFNNIKRFDLSEAKFLGEPSTDPSLIIGGITPIVTGYKTFASIDFSSLLSLDLTKVDFASTEALANNSNIFIYDIALDTFRDSQFTQLKYLALNGVNVVPTWNGNDPIMIDRLFDLTFAGGTFDNLKVLSFLNINFFTKQWFLDHPFLNIEIAFNSTFGFAKTSADAPPPAPAPAPASPSRTLKVEWIYLFNDNEIDTFYHLNYFTHYFFQDRYADGRPTAYTIGKVIGNKGKYMEMNPQWNWFINSNYGNNVSWQTSFY